MTARAATVSDSYLPILTHPSPLDTRTWSEVFAWYTRTGARPSTLWLPRPVTMTAGVPAGAARRRTIDSCSQCTTARRDVGVQWKCRSTCVHSRGQQKRGHPVALHGSRWFRRVLDLVGLHRLHRPYFAMLTVHLDDPRSCRHGRNLSVRDKTPQGSQRRCVGPWTEGGFSAGLVDRGCAAGALARDGGRVRADHHSP